MSTAQRLAGLTVSPIQRPGSLLPVLSVFVSWSMDADYRHCARSPVPSKVKTTFRYHQHRPLPVAATTVD